MGKISVMWDIGNCPVPAKVAEQPHSIAQNIRSALTSSSLDFIPTSVSIDVFGNTEVLPQPLSDALSSTGIRVNRIASPVTEILVAILCWALDNPPPAHILLISGDGGFASVLHQLRLRQYNVLLACSDGHVSPGLLCAAATVFDWLSVSAGIASPRVNLPKPALHLKPQSADRPADAASCTALKEINNAFRSLKDDQLMPTLRNLEEWWRYSGGHKEIGVLLSEAIEMDLIATVNVPPGKTLVYLPLNAELWPCVDLNNTRHNYSGSSWKILRQYLLDKKEWKLFSKSQSRYEAAHILKKSGISVVSGFSVGEILHFFNLLKNRGWISFHKTDWLPLTRNLERIKSPIQER